MKVLAIPREIKNRQLCEPLLRENGAVYAIRCNVLMEMNRLFGRNPTYISKWKKSFCRCFA
jgi:CMP-N-acetylneuraminic acid synthetase